MDVVKFTDSRTSTQMDRAGIPAMTHRDGRYWQQPSRNAIEVDEKYALMSQRAFDALSNYSASTPTGVYEGKMWKRLDGAHDRACPVECRRWLLCWYGPSRHSDRCSVNYREILIVE